MIDQIKNYFNKLGSWSTSNIAAASARRPGAVVKFCLCSLIVLGAASGVQTHLAQNKAEPTPDGRKYSCLPSGIKPDTIAAVRRIETRIGIRIAKETVKQRLDKIKGRCRAGVLVDPQGRRVRFYELQGCWGNPPADYLEILEKQRRELEKLKKMFNVIEITCDPLGTSYY